MASLIAFANGTKFRGRRKEAQGSANANSKAMTTPRGILRGFRPVPAIANRTLRFDVDPLLGDSVVGVTPVDTADAGDGYLLTYRETDFITLDLSSEAGNTIFVGLSAEYNPATSAASAPRWQAYSQAEIDDGTADEAVIFCSVDVPASAIALVAADIDESERDEPWMWVSARGSDYIPLVSPSLDDQFLFWSFQSLAASSTLSMTTTDQKFGNASILLDVNDAGAVTNEFGPGEVVSVVPGQPLFVKFWYRTSASVNFSTNPLFKIEFLRANGTTLGTTDISIPTGAQTSFTLIQDQVIVPAEGNRAIFSFDVQTNGVTDFYVDGLQVYTRRLDSDVGGWLDDNTKFLARNMGHNMLWFQGEHNNTTTNGPWRFGLESGGIALRKEAGTTRNVIIGETTGLESTRVGINTVPDVDKMLHMRSTLGKATIRLERDDLDIGFLDAYGAIEFVGQDNSGSADGVRGQIRGVANGVAGSMAIAFYAAGNSEAEPPDERGRFTVNGLGLGDFSSSADPVDTFLHMRSTAGAGAPAPGTVAGNVLRMELDNTTIAADDVYGRIEWEGQDSDTNAAGIRGFIAGVAESADGAMDLSFGVAFDNEASPAPEVMRLTSFGNNIGALGLGDFSSGQVDRMLHLKNPFGTAILRFDRDETDITNGEIYGSVEWYGRDTGFTGVRAEIEVQAEANSGGAALHFKTSAHADAGGFAPVRAKLNNFGTFIVADNFSVFDTTDTTDYGFDIGSDSLGMVIQADNANDSNVLALYNSNTGAKDNQSEIRFYREDGTLGLNRIGAILCQHEGSSSDLLGELLFYVNDGTTATGMTQALHLNSNSYATFGSGGDGTTAADAGLKLVGSSATASDMTLTFEETRASFTGTEAIGSIDFYMNHSTNTGVAASIKGVGGTGTSGDGNLYFYTRPSGGSLGITFTMNAAGDCAATGGLTASDDLVVGATSPTNSSVGIELSSTTKALLLSRMTGAQITTLDAAGGQAGMLVYRTDAPAGFQARVASGFQIIPTVVTPAADGTGSAVVLGSVGGSGRPATAAQNGWMRVEIGGTAHYVPTWQ